MFNVPQNQEFSREEIEMLAILVTSEEEKRISGQKVNQYIKHPEKLRELLDKVNSLHSIIYDDPEGTSSIVAYRSVKW